MLLSAPPSYIDTKNGVPAPTILALIVAVTFVTPVVKLSDKDELFKDAEPYSLAPFTLYAVGVLTKYRFHRYQLKL